MSTLTGLLGGPSGVPAVGVPEIIFLSSSSWSPKFDMKAMVFVIGGGGSGAAASGSSTYRATGGAGGGTAISILELSSSSTYNVSVGAGGGSRSAFSTRVDGYLGGTSNFTGGGVTAMSGGGGGGGFATVSPTVTYATGGTASGGNVDNRTGISITELIVEEIYGPGGYPDLLESRLDNPYFSYSQRITQLLHYVGYTVGVEDAPYEILPGVSEKYPSDYVGVFGGTSGNSYSNISGPGAPVGGGASGGLVNPSGNAFGARGGSGIVIVKPLEIYL